MNFAQTVRILFLVWKYGKAGQHKLGWGNASTSGLSRPMSTGVHHGSWFLKLQRQKRAPDNKNVILWRLYLGSLYWPLLSTRLQKLGLLCATLVLGWRTFENPWTKTLPGIFQENFQSTSFHWQVSAENSDWKILVGDLKSWKVHQEEEGEGLKGWRREN